MILVEQLQCRRNPSRHRMLTARPARHRHRRYAKAGCELPLAQPDGGKGNPKLRAGHGSSAEIFNGDERPGADHNHAAEPHHHRINAPVELLEPQIEPLLHFAQIGLGGDIVVNGVIDLGRDSLSGLASHAAAFQRAGQGEAVSHGAVSYPPVAPNPDLTMR